MSELLQGSIVFVFAWLLIGGIGAPVPEDVALLGAGVLIQRGAVSWPVAVIVAVVGVLGGDAILFLTARRLGPRAFERKLFQRILPPERRAKVEGLYARYGGRMVFIARHVAGLRAAVFAMAGIVRMAPRRFFFWDGLAAMLSIPFVVGLGYFGAAHIERVHKGIAKAQHLVLLLLALAVLGFLTWRHLHLRSARLRELKASSQQR